MTQTFGWGALTTKAGDLRAALDAVAALLPALPPPAVDAAVAAAAAAAAPSPLEVRRRVLRAALAAAKAEVAALSDVCSVGSALGPPSLPVQEDEQTRTKRVALQESLIGLALKRARSVTHAAELVAAGARRLAPEEAELATKLALFGAARELERHIRGLANLNDLAASMRKLLETAAISEGVREWYPVDPEMSLIRHTAIIPEAMTVTTPEKKDDKPEEEAPPPSASDAFYDLLEALFGVKKSNAPK